MLRCLAKDASSVGLVGRDLPTLGVVWDVFLVHVWCVFSHPWVYVLVIQVLCAWRICVAGPVPADTASVTMVRGHILRLGMGISTI